MFLLIIDLQEHLTDSSELILRCRHAVHSLLEQGQSSSHISTKLKEFVSSCREFDGDGRLLLSLAALIHRLGLNFWELFQVDVHSDINVEGFAGALRRVLGT